jgi:hypothetical protein
MLAQTLVYKMTSLMTETKTTQQVPSATIWMHLMRKNMPAPINRLIQNMVATSRDQTKARHTKAMGELLQVHEDMNYIDWPIPMIVDNNRLSREAFSAKYSKYLSMRQVEEYGIEREDAAMDRAYGGNEQ